MKTLEYVGSPAESSSNSHFQCESPTIKAQLIRFERKLFLQHLLVVKVVTQNWDACKVTAFGSNPQSQAMNFRSFTPSKVLHNSLFKCNCTKAIHAGLWALIMHYYNFVSMRQNLPFYFATSKIWHFQRTIRALFVIPQYDKLKPSLLEEQGKNRKQGIFVS